MDASHHQPWLGTETGHLMMINPFPTHDEQVLYGHEKQSLAISSARGGFVVLLRLGQF